MIEFDLSEITGQSHVIVSATLEVYQISHGTVNTNIGVRRVNSSWNESTVTWNTRPSWGGANYDTCISPAGSTWLDFNIKNMVQEWADGTDNYGLVLVHATGTSCSPPRVASSDHATASWRPKLTIEYVTSSIEHTSWGTIKAVDY